MKDKPNTPPTTPPAPAPESDEVLPRSATLPSGEGYVEPGLEDRLIAWWEKNRTLVLGAIGVAAVAVIGWQVWRFVDTRRQEALAQEFAAAQTAADRLAFAQRHNGLPTSGAAMLLVADEAAAAANWAEAATRYEAAATALVSVPELAGRARVGQALSLFQAEGGRDRAVTLLQAISADATLLDVHRAEAAYTLAIHFWSTQQWELLRNQFDQIDRLPYAGIWKRRASDLRSDIPELRRAPATPAPTP